MEHCPHCGCDLDEAPSHGRSVPQNRRLHALVRELYHQWPEHGFDKIIPKSSAHLRYWLTSQIEGYFDVLRPIRMKTTRADIAYNVLKIVLEESDAQNVFIEIDDTQIVRKRAHSIAFEKMEHAAATKLFSQIDDVVGAYGFNAYKLLEEAKLRGHK